MNLNDFKRILQDIRKQLPCPHCKKALEEKTIHLIGTMMDASFFMGRCLKCEHDMFIHVTHLRGERTHRGLDANAHLKLVDKNDILDMHNFLKEFNGDFISLFTKKV